MATTYGAPGVYVEEIASGSRPIEAVGTAVAAFIGFTSTYDPDRGSPADPDGVQPQLVTSWNQYERIFGGYAAGALLPHAVNGFFANGGTKAYVVRIPRPGVDEAIPVATVPAAAHGDVASLRITARDPAASLQVVVEHVPSPSEEGGEPPQEFTLRVLREGAVVEEFPRLTMSRGAQNAEKIGSETITVTAPRDSGTPVSERLPQEGTFALEKPAETVATVSISDLEGNSAARTGYQGLDITEDVTMVAIPDLVTVTTGPDDRFDLEAYIAAQGRLVDWCEAGHRAMAILDAPPHLDPTAARQWLAALARSSPFAAAYYPHLVVANPLARPGATSRELFVTVPPSGHAAGVWARTDSERGVWKAPANEVVRGIVRVATEVTTGEQDVLNPEGINCIRTFRNQGIRLWGARTLATQAQPEWRYIPIRRLFSFIEESIRAGTQWAVFEPNDLDLQQRVKRTINAFLLGLWRQGALVGSSPGEAYYVICDGTNNPRESVEEGKLVVEVGVCPVRPAEFVIFRIAQWQGGGETTD